MNDKMNEDEFEDFIESFILSSQKHIKEGSPYYICFGERNSINFLSAFKKANLHHSCNIIWKKHRLEMGRTDNQYIHEPIILSVDEEDEVSIKEVALLVAKHMNFEGNIVFDIMYIRTEGTKQNL